MNNRKNNRILVPINENTHSPDVPNKFMAKNYYDVPTTQSYSNPPLLKEFTESPDYLFRKNKNDEFPSNISLTDLNSQLDKNLNEVISLLNRRKNLVAIKKRKVLQMAEDQLSKVRQNGAVHDIDYLNDEDFIKITNFCQNPRTAIKMLGKVVHTISQMREPRPDYQQQKSKVFWARNTKLENDIDMMLQKLKQLDKQLQKQNGDIFEVCKELDRIEETLKAFVGTKSPDHMQKIEPLFNSKKKNYDVLNKKLKEREAWKDKKIQYTKRIMGILEDLTKTRQNRLGQIADFYGMEDSYEFDQLNFKDQDFGTGLEELFKMKQRDNQLQLSEREVYAELDVMEKEQQKIYNDLLKIISDQAKSFYNFSSIQSQRIRCNSILKIFQTDTENFSIDRIDPKEFLKKFKEVKFFFKKFLQEDSLVKQGLLKTATTEKTFINMLKATENERERRGELLSLLETCIKKRQQYQQKRDEMRDIQFQYSKNDQSLLRYEQDLEAVLTDGDLDGYKKIGGAIGKCESEKNRLNQVRELLEKQMEAMDREVLGIANRIKEEYEDILADVLPSNYEYSLKSGEDVKKLRNQLRKMYKRLGLLSNQ